jgi:LPXTG-site transpeptidase (sortase) family protein
MKHLRRVFVLLVLLTTLLATPVLPAKATAFTLETFLNPDGTLRMEAVNDGALDLGGWDVQLDPQRGPIFRPAALNGTWSTLGSGLNNNVFAITVRGSNIYVGGWFTNAGGNPNADYIAVWDGSAWSALGSGLNGEVFVIAVSGSNVYVGGNFTSAGGTSANRIAVWNGTNWSALGSGLNGLVRAIAVSGSNIYVGGSFTTAGGSSANHIAVWDSTNWSVLGGGLNGEVLAIAVSGSNVYVGGNFINAGGNPNADYIAVWNGSAWSALGSGLNAEVFAIAISGSNVYVGGSFTSAGGIPANRIARWDSTTSTWSALGSGLNGPVYVLAINGSNVYVGGSISAAGGNPANRIAVWDGTTSTWSALGNGVDSFVYAITISGSNVYVGGNFTTAGGIAANYIARFLVDTAPPTIIFGAGSMPPSDGVNLTMGPSQLVVRFSENVLGDGSQHAANSGWNYMLLRPGPNGVFDTTIDTPIDPEPICDSDHVAEGDDERIDILTINYAAGTFAATITIDPFYAPLANGTYRLYVCGEASVWDLASNPLNGGANTAINFTVGPAAAPVAPAAAEGNRSKLPSTGFPPNRVTLLPPQTVPYADLGDLWLEVPKLGLKMPIVGVPKKNEEWNVSWLGKNAGWLEGSAYPSWNGNSVLTGHVWNADNSAGPFVYLNTLWWGDKVIVHISGQQYIYEIRSVKQVAPTDVSAMMKHEELPWLTLVSCKGYNEKTGKYSYRVLVRAVLVDVK